MGLWIGFLSCTVKSVCLRSGFHGVLTPSKKPGGMMISSTQFLAYLASNKMRFQREYHLTKIGVFGSIARNEQMDDSDIDLIIEFEDNTDDLFDLKQKLKAEIMNEFNVSVDICREKYIKPVFRKQILSEAKYV